MSRLEEGRQARTDTLRILTGSIQLGDRVGDEANNNVDKFLKDLSGRSVEESYLVVRDELFQKPRNK